MPPSATSSASTSVDARVEPGHDTVEVARLARSPSAPRSSWASAAGSWCGYGANADGPWDQRADDGMAVCFDTEPLSERLEILGAPVLTLEVSSDRPNAFLCARLCDVAPDGASLRVTYGLLNLAHRESHERPEPLEPGRRYPVRLQLNDIAHAFPPGHRIRLALSTTYWPIAWPSPQAATVTVLTAGSRLSLPVRAPRPERRGRSGRSRQPRARRPRRAPRFARAASSAPSATTSRATP